MHPKNTIKMEKPTRSRNHTPSKSIDPLNTHKKRSNLIKKPTLYINFYPDSTPQSAMSLPTVSDSPLVAGRVENPVSFSDDEDDAPLEPFFNYRLIDEKDVKNMLRDDKITSLVAHDKFLAIGTSQGYIYLMSHEGTMDHTHIPRIKAHRQPVARLDVELTGNYVISCANDARVVISGLGTDVLNYTLSLLWIPKSVTISPSFSRSSGPPQFAVGERNLALYEKKFFKYNPTVLFQGGEKDGFVNRISWNESYIAFTNDTGTRIYDTNLRKLITLISPSHDVDRIRSSRFPPSHCWLSQESLAIGWADTVTVIVIVDTDRGITISKHSEIHHSFQLNGMFLSGISFVADQKGDWEKLVLFGLKPAEGDDETDFCDTSSMVSMQSLIDKGGPAPLIQVSVISPETERYYKLHSEDRLGLEACSASQPTHFTMVGLPAFDSYFITGPNCLVSATPYGALNAVKWRLDKGLWEEAFDLAKQKAYELEETEYNSATVGRQMIQHYLSIGRPRLAAAKLKEVCGESRCEWEWAVQLFEQSHISTLLVEILPTSHPQLDKHCYEGVLQASLWNDTNLFRKMVQTWSPDLYGAGYISVLTLGRLQRAGTPGQDASLSLSQEDELNLYRALAHLYLYERKFEQAIKIYITMIKDVQIFNIIDKYQLFDQVKDQISDLMTIHTDRALRLLLDNEDSVSPHFVMSKLTQKPKLQMAYLNRLFSKGEGAEYADRAVQLYAEYDRKKLIKFLKNNEHYNILKALDICRQKGFHEETILLYGKSGNHREALLLMMKEYKQLDRAIEYCREHEDEDLWNQLIDLVVKSREHIVGLLKQVGSSINPLNIIQKIPRDLEVSGLRDALAKVLRDCAARVELLRGCREATYSDTTLLFTDFLKVNRRAFPLGPRSLCIVCRKKFMTEEASKWSDLIVFGCGHTSHVNCAESERKLHFRTGTCPLCSENREEILD